MVLRTLRELWKYRDLAGILVEKELKLRYRRSVLGFAWTMLNPHKFPVFLLSALLPWNFFSQSLTGGSLSIVHNESLLKNVYTPRAIYPIALVASHLVNLVLAFVPLILVMFWQGAPLTWSVLALPLCLAILALFTTGVVLAFSAWTVFFRDLRQILEVGLQALFYLIPIIYPLTVIPARYLWAFEWNPLVHLIQPFRSIFLHGAWPSPVNLAVGGACAVVAFVVGLSVFRRHESFFLHYLS
jgi:ABC-type polysaccharide/polyol phosphate export permease